MMTSSSSPVTTLSAVQLPLPKPLHTQSPQTSSILHDPISQTTAIRHSDSSFSLYPSFSPINFPSQPSIIPSPTSSATFLHLLGPTPTTLFLTSSPLLPQNFTLLRLHVFRNNRFLKISNVVSSHRDVEFDKGKGGVVFKVNHGVSMRLSGGVNVFSLYSVSDSRIWVFSVKLVDKEELKLIKCAVIECCFRVFEVKVLFGVLVLGEENGVRVFALRPLVKGGKWSKEKKSGGGRKGVKSASAGGDLNFLSSKGEKGEKNSDSDGNVMYIVDVLIECVDPSFLRMLSPLLLGKEQYMNSSFYAF